jgi:DNA (cytosine-5)-methyltransferase 1
MRVVQHVRPKAFLIENVPELLRSPEFEGIRRVSRRLGYSLDYDVLNAADFGVPQSRRRAFIVGLKARVPKLPKSTGERATVRDAIGDLPLAPTGKDWHIGRNPMPMSIARYRCIPPGGSRFDLMRRRPDLCPRCWLQKPTGSTDVFGRLEWDKPALTIRTEFFKPEKGRYLHPEAHRPITHREAARLQTFPDSFHFYGSKIQVAKQIGNAVPPRLAQVIALSIKAAIS